MELAPLATAASAPWGPNFSPLPVTSSTARLLCTRQVQTRELCPELHADAGSYQKKKKKSRCMGPGPGALPAKPAEAQPGTGRGWGASGRPRKTGLSGLTGCERGLPAWHSWRLQMVAGRDEEPLRLPVDSSCCSYEAQLSSGGMAVSEWCRWGYGPSPMSPTIKAPSPTDGGLTTGRADAPGQRRHRI